MRYASARAFRQALEDRLRHGYPRQQIPRLRKMIAFERFMARLDDNWILKGGYALQLRTDRARTTQDIDLLARPVVADDIFERLVHRLRHDMGDYFSFTMQRSPADLNLGGATRFRVTSRVDGRVFERFQLDVGTGDPIVEDVEYLDTPDLLSFAEIARVTVPCYPVSQQLAEKIRAYTQEYASGRSSRVKDFVDMILLGELGELTGKSVIAAIEASFAAADVRVAPAALPPPPQNWLRPFRRLAGEVGLAESDLDAAYATLQQFIDPVLNGSAASSQWQPETWMWK